MLKIYDFENVLNGGDRKKHEMKKMALTMKEKNVYLLSEMVVRKFYHWNDRQVVLFHKYYSQLADIREIIRHPLDAKFQ